MALTFTEKQHWKNRIERTVSGTISQLRELSANVIEGLKAKAEEAIERELNITEELAEYKKRAEEIADLEKQQRELLNFIAADVYGEDLPYRVDVHEIQRQVEMLVKERIQDLFSAHPLGQHQGYLEAEKARLLDGVLLAVNVQQISDLLDQAAALEPLPEPVAEEAPVEQPPLMLSDYSLQ